MVGPRLSGLMNCSRLSCFIMIEEAGAWIGGLKIGGVDAWIGGCSLISSDSRAFLTFFFLQCCLHL